MHQDLGYHNDSAGRRYSMPISDAISRRRENATTIRTFSCKLLLQHSYVSLIAAISWNECSHF